MKPRQKCGVVALRSLAAPSDVLAQGKSGLGPACSAFRWSQSQLAWAAGFSHGVLDLPSKLKPTPSSPQSLGLWPSPVLYPLSCCTGTHSLQHRAQGQATFQRPTSAPFPVSNVFGPLPAWALFPVQPIALALLPISEAASTSFSTTPRLGFQGSQRGQGAV